MSATLSSAFSPVAVNESDLPSPDFDAPWMGFFNTIGGFIIATVLSILVALMVIGILIWVAGKVGIGGRAQESGIGAFVIGAVGAVLIGIASMVIVYATDIGPEWMDFDTMEAQQQAAGQVTEQFTPRS